MKKTIKLKENDIINIVKRVIVEQELPPYPEKNSPVNNTPTEIIEAKKRVFESLNSAIGSIKRLIELSGVNPENNNIVQDIEKVKDKFNNLFGYTRKNEKKN